MSEELKDQENEDQGNSGTDSNRLTHALPGGAGIDKGFDDLEAPESWEEPQTGSLINERFRIVDKLGQGGFGVVFIAEDQALDRRVALKFLEAGSGANIELENRREFLLASRVAHENVCRVYDVGQHRGRPFFFMEYPSGDTLLKFMEVFGKPTPELFEVYVRQLCAGLKAIHDQGIIHCDLKPGNLLVEEKTKVLKIIDFGEAVIEGAVVKGLTREYCPPELIEPRAYKSRDIYSLGIILYELYSGKSLELERTGYVSRPDPGFADDPDLEQAILQCMDPKPDQRPKSISALLKQLFPKAPPKQILGSPPSPKAESSPKAEPSPEGESSPEDAVTLVSDSGTPALPESPVQRLRYTICLELIGYPSLAIEYAGKTGGLDKLRSETQELIDDSLSSLKLNSAKAYSWEQAGTWFLFLESAELAHQFAVNLHKLTEKLNKGLSEALELRYFRIAIAMDSTAIRNTKLSQASAFSSLNAIEASELKNLCRTGEIVISAEVFESLEITPQVYGPSESETYSDGESLSFHRYRKVIDHHAPWDQKVLVACGFSLDSLLQEDSQGSIDLLRENHRQRCDELSSQYFGRDVSNELEVETRDGTVSYISFSWPEDAVRFALRYRSEMRLPVDQEVLPPYLRAGAGISSIPGSFSDEATPELHIATAREALAILECSSYSNVLLSEKAYHKWLSHRPSRKDLIWKLISAPTPIEGAESDLLGEVYERGDHTRSDLSWRPAEGRRVPGAEQWKLQERLNPDGFFEVWLAEYSPEPEEETDRRPSPSPSQQLSVFKFALKPTHLDILRNEKSCIEALLEGDSKSPRGDIVRMISSHLGASPSYLQFEYYADGDLLSWLEAHRDDLSTEQKPAARRQKLELMEHLAASLEFIHGRIVHSDLKLENILVRERDGRILPVIADFGSAYISGNEPRPSAHLLKTSQRTSSRSTTTQTFRAPELNDNSTPTIESDVWAFGVMFLQVMSGDLRQGPAPGWRKTIESECLKEDLVGIFRREPSRRPSMKEISTTWFSEGYLAREAQWEAQQKQVELDRRKKQISELRLAATFLFLAFAVLSIILYMAVVARNQAIEAQKNTNAAMDFVTKTFRITDPNSTPDASYPDGLPGLNATAGELLALAADRMETELQDQPRVRAPVLETLGTIYLNLGNRDEADDLLGKSLELWQSHEQWIDEDPLGFASMLKSYANLQRFQSQYHGPDGALALLHRALEIAEKQSDEIKAVEIRSDLATTYSDVGDYLKSLPMAKTVAESLSAKVDAGEPQVSLNLLVNAEAQLALILSEMGKYQEALDLIEARSTQLPPLYKDRPSVAGLKTAQAKILLEAGENPEIAKSLLDESLASLRIHYESLQRKSEEFPDHPSIIYNLNNLGLAALYLGDLQGAKSHLAEAQERLDQYDLEPNQQVDAPIQAAISANKAIVAEFSGEGELAEALYKQAINTLAHFLHPEHPRIALIKSNMASFYQRSGNFEKAGDLFEEAEAIQQTSLVEWSHQRAATLNDHGLLLKDLGRFQEAMAKMCEASVIVDRLPYKKRASAEIKNGVALMLESSGSFLDARALNREALNDLLSKEVGAGEDDLAVLATQSNLAYVLVQIADLHQSRSETEEAAEVFADALKLFEAAKAGFEKMEEGPGPATVSMIRNLGFLYERQLDHEQALKLYGEALKKGDGVEPERNIAKTHSYLARLYLVRGDLPKAKEHSETALRLFEKTLEDANHWRFAHVQSILAGIKIKQGLHSEAHPLLSASLPILLTKGKSSVFYRDALTYAVQLDAEKVGGSENLPDYEKQLSEALNFPAKSPGSPCQKFDQAALQEESNADHLSEENEKS